VPVAVVNGTGLYHEVEGEGGPWLVFAHGGEGTRLHWWAQVADFRRDHRCVVYDARGFGSSPVGDVPPSDNLHRDDLTALLDHLGIERAGLVGHSMGGLAVSGVAQREPGRVERLVMSDTPFGFATPALAEWSASMIERITNGFAVLDHLYAPGFDERAPALSYLYRALGRLNPERQGPRGLEVYEAWRDQPAADYSAFPVPTLFLVGTEDELTRPWLVRATAERVAGSVVVEIDGAGHSAYAEQPDVFNATVRAFLAGTLDPGP
jgi:pimeloyl-ACP methyl ester carboxylesterase